MALYQRWTPFPLIDRAGPDSAYAAARGLRIDRLVREPDGACLVTDLLAAAPLDDATRRLPELVEAMNALPDQVPRGTLARLLEAPLFVTESGEQLPLASWDASGKACRRALGAVRAVLAFGTQPLLALEEEAALASLLQSLDVQPATLADMVDAMKRDPQLQSAEARDGARRALAEGPSEAALTFPPTSSGEPHPVLAALAIWPTTDGRHLPAGEVVRRKDVDDALGELGVLVGEAEVAILAEQAERQAERLRGLVRFRSPASLLVSRVRAWAREGEPLEHQEPLLATVDHVVRVLAVASQQLGSPVETLKLPLAVDAAGCLVCGSRWTALPEEIELAEGLPLHAKLAHPQWAREASRIDQELCPALPPRRLATALAQEAQAPVVVDAHPLFAQANRRLALYRWLETRGETIEADLEAMAVLGRSCLIPDAEGILQAPRELLIEEPPSDLEIGGGLHPEVPEVVRDWLRRAFQLDDERIRQLVTRVLDAHEQAVKQEDVQRSRALLTYLASVLLRASKNDDTMLTAAARRWNVRKRLRVATEEGGFERPRRLLMPEEETWERMVAFDAEPAQRPHTVYACENISRLLFALGTEKDLSCERVGELLAGRRTRSGRDARVALARYVALRAFGEPPLRNRWHLDRDPWMPNARGKLCVPSSLFWPSATVRAVVGDDPALYPGRCDGSDLAVGCGAVASVQGASRCLPVRCCEQLDDERAGSNSDPRVVGGIAGLRAHPCGRGSHLPRRTRFGSSITKERCAITSTSCWRTLQSFGVGDGANGGPAAGFHGSLLSCISLVNQVRGSTPGTSKNWRPRLLPARSSRKTPRCWTRFFEAQRCLRCRRSASNERPSSCKTKRERGGLALLPGDAVAVPDRDGLADELVEPPLRVAVLDDDAADQMVEWLVALGAVRMSVLLEPAVEPELSPRSSPQPSAEGGWLRRLQQWFAGDEAADSSARSSSAVAKDRRPSTPKKQPEQPTEVRQANWFQTQDAIRPQLDDLRDWLGQRDDRPRFGFAFSPSRLRLPWTYAPKIIADHFDSQSQRWMSRVLDPSWLRGAGRQRSVLTLQGRVPIGNVVLPMPTSSRLLGFDGAPDARVVVSSSGQTLLIAPTEVEVTLHVALDQPAPFDQAAPCPSPPRELLVQAVPDEELPREVLDFVSDCVSSEGSSFERALQVREFVRDRYRYDPSYMGDPALAKWLRSVSDGRASMHIAALHAGRDARHLGRGVCYELNSLVCELLRRVGVPAAVAVGWTLDRGFLSEPDHLWAMALLPTPLGYRWLPVDASATRDGRPLHARSSKAAGPWRVPPQARDRTPRAEPAWARRERESFKLPRKGKRQPPVAELMRVIRHAARVGQVDLGQGELQARCREVLADPERLATLLSTLELVAKRRQ